MTVRRRSSDSSVSLSVKQGQCCGAHLALVRTAWDGPAPACGLELRVLRRSPPSCHPVTGPLSPQHLGTICPVLVPLGRVAGRGVCDLRELFSASWGEAWVSSRGDEHSFRGRLRDSEGEKACGLPLWPPLHCPSPRRRSREGDLPRFQLASGLPPPVAGYTPRAGSSVLHWKPHVGSPTNQHSDCGMTVGSLGTWLWRWWVRLQCCSGGGLLLPPLPGLLWAGMGSSSFSPPPCQLSPSILPAAGRWGRP